VRTTLSGLVKRRFIHCVTMRGETVTGLVNQTQISPHDLCRIIAGQSLDQLPILAYYRIAQWLCMPLSNVLSLAATSPDLKSLIRLGMEVHHYCPSSTHDQIQAAREAGIGVAVFRRALHGYADFRPSIRTCDKLAAWLSWSGFTGDDIAVAAGMVVKYREKERRVTLSLDASEQLAPYPCACGRAGCMIPAHIPSGPRRKWRSDACRMWAKRRNLRVSRIPLKPEQDVCFPLPHPDPVVRFITINERRVPVRF
jgi:hypothetical protein